MEKLNRPDEAVRLYHELAAGYPDSQAAGQAKTRLEELSGR
jgi:TolA-binding protein